MRVHVMLDTRDYGSKNLSWLFSALNICLALTGFDPIMVRVDAPCPKVARLSRHFLPLPLLGTQCVRFKEKKKKKTLSHQHHSKRHGFFCRGKSLYDVALFSNYPESCSQRILVTWQDKDPRNSCIGFNFSIFFIYKKKILFQKIAEEPINSSKKNLIKIYPSTVGYTH